MTRRTWGALRLGLLRSSVGFGAILNCESFIGGVCQRFDLARNIGRSVSFLTGSAFAVSFSLSLCQHLESQWMKADTHTTSTATSATSRTSTTATTPTTAGIAPARLAVGSRFGSCGRLIRLARQLHGDLAVKNGLAIELAQRALSLRGSRDIDKGVADWASGARVEWD